MADARTLAEAIAGLTATTSLELLVVRDGWNKHLTLRAPSRQSGASRSEVWLGLQVADSGDSGNRAQGARVTAVDPGGPAISAGLQTGDLITAAQGQKITTAAEFATVVRNTAPGEILTLQISRAGWTRAITLRPATRASTQTTPRPEHAGAIQDADTSESVGDAAYARPDRLKAKVAVAEFQVEAAKAGEYVGDGLREMLLTEMHRSGYFIVIEHDNADVLAAEPPLSVSAMSRTKPAAPPGTSEVADIMIRGTVKEFDPEAGGYGFPSFISELGLLGWQQSKYAEMTIDISAVDIATGQVLIAESIPGTAASYRTAIVGTRWSSVPGTPSSLNAFKNTPMEVAIRECIQKAALAIVNGIPQSYFRHR